MTGKVFPAGPNQRTTLIVSHDALPSDTVSGLGDGSVGDPEQAAVATATKHHSV